MAKKDFGIKENTDREGKEKDNPLSDSQHSEKKDVGKTEVKNANAAGLGAMGRNDEEGTANS